MLLTAFYIFRPVTNIFGRIENKIRWAWHVMLSLSFAHVIMSAISFVGMVAYMTIFFITCNFICWKQNKFGFKIYIIYIFITPPDENFVIKKRQITRKIKRITLVILTFLNIFFLCFPVFCYLTENSIQTSDKELIRLVNFSILKSMLTSKTNIF